MVKNSKSGVAVIIVLGLLALLMVLGVAFTVTMRGERAGSANYLASTASRHMVWAGLSRGIDAINESMDGRMFPEGDYLVSVEEDYLVSGAGGNWNQHGNAGVALLTRQIRGYLPDSIANFISEQDPPVRSQWLSLPDGGRTAFLVVNVSDMLDANYVGGEDRAGGRSVSELMLATNVFTVNEYANFITSRSDAGGSFDNPRDFRTQAPDVPYELLSTYSRYLPDTNRLDVVYIGGDDLADRRSEIEAAIEAGLPQEGNAGATGINAAQASRIFDLLLDYVSEDAAPNNLQGPNIKPVPLINEVVAEIRQIAVGGDPAALGFEFRPRIDTWYPFVRQSENSFVIEGEYSASIDESGGGSVTNSGSFSSETTISQPRHDGGENGFYHPAIDSISMMLPDVSPTNTFEIRVAFSNLVVEQVGEGVVDQVDGNFRYETQWTEGVSAGDMVFEPETYQVSDPRFNWQVPSDTTASTSPWQTVEQPFGGGSGNLSPSIGQTNAWAEFFLNLRDQGDQPGIQKGSEMHSSGAGVLYSPLELGNLLLLPNATLNSPGNYWRHLRVFDHVGSVNTVRRHRMLETFTTNSQFPAIEDGEESAMRGLVNINTVEDRILRTLFTGMPYPYVGGNALENSYPVRLDAVLSIIQEHVDANDEFRSINDLIDLDWRDNPALEDLSDLELEALLAYAVELTGVRHNLFLIVSTATSLEGGDNLVRGRRNAMAFVWRDPVPNEDGLHDQFIQYFRWLD